MAIVASMPMMATTIMISTSVKPRMGAFLFFILNLSLKRRERDNRRVYYDYQDSFTYCRLPTADKLNTGHAPRLRSRPAERGSDGQDHAHRGAFAGARFELHLSAVGLDDACHNGQAQARALLLRGVEDGGECLAAL